MLQDLLPPARPPVVLRTEPHAIARYSLLDGTDWPVVDLEDLRADRPGAPRRERIAEAARRLAPELHGTTRRGVVFDATEAWFATSLFHRLRRHRPRPFLLGLQHGVMAKTGPESRLPVRWARWQASRLGVRIRGYARRGAGFGNLPYDAYVCYGRSDAAYFRRLHPATRTIVSFRSLQQLEHVAGDRGADAVFLAQDLEVFGVRDAADAYRRILARIAAVTQERGWTTVVKPHPKIGLPVEVPRVAPVLSEAPNVPLTTLLRPGRTVAVSFNSTALLEAAYLGCPIVAIRPPGIAAKWHAMFRDSVPLDTFAAAWDGDARSQVVPGVID